MKYNFVDKTNQFSVSHTKNFGYSQYEREGESCNLRFLGKEGDTWRAMYFRKVMMDDLEHQKQFARDRYQASHFKVFLDDYTERLYADYLEELAEDRNSEEYNDQYGPYGHSYGDEDYDEPYGRGPSYGW